MNLNQFNYNLKAVATQLAKDLGYKSYRKLMQAYPRYEAALHKLKYHNNYSCSSYSVYRVAFVLNVEFVITRDNIYANILDPVDACVGEPRSRRYFALQCMDIDYELKDRGVAYLDAEYSSYACGCLRNPIAGLGYNEPHSFFATSMLTIVELVPEAKLIINPQGIHVEVPEELYPLKEVVVSNETRVCYHCGETKNVSLFLRGKYSNLCRVCCSDLNKKWQNPEVALACTRRNNRKYTLDRDNKKVKLGFKLNKKMCALEVVQKINTLKESN